MSLPPFAIAAALAFWGWRSGHYGAAIVLALIVEAPRFVRLRFDLRHADFARIADLCTVLFAGMLATLFLTTEAPRTATAVLTTMLWLPALLVPVLLAQRYSTSGHFPLSGLFLYLRKLRERDPQYRERELDLGPIYFAICLLASGIPNERDAIFYMAFVGLLAWALAAARPSHARVAPWATAIGVAAVLGYGGHLGLNHAQMAFEDWVSDWILRGMAADPYRSTTDLGAVGRLKMIDAIVMRVYPEPAQAAPPSLLHRASFTTFEGTTWTAKRSPMSALLPEADGISWKLASGRPQRRTRIFIRLDGGKALLALPPGTVQLGEMAAAAVRHNTLGAVQADFGGDWAPYIAQTAPVPDNYAPPAPDDLQIAKRELATLERVAAELRLKELSPRQALERIREHLASFHYATYRAAPIPRGSTALEDFLLRTKAGHCEYFAAATTLLLRTAGVPARYATGFAVAEYSALEKAYVVRARHAHAWARAYIDGGWIDVDTTPPSWTEEEAREAPAWQPIADFFRWAQFRWSQAGPLELGMGWASVLVVALGFFGWRLLRGKRASASAKRAANEARRFAGVDSEFYAIEAKLASHASARAPHESIGAWLRRIEPHLDSTLRKAIAEAQGLHYRYRFDPRGLDAAERQALRVRCLALGARLESPHG